MYVWGQYLDYNKLSGIFYFDFLKNPGGRRRPRIFRYIICKSLQLDIYAPCCTFKQWCVAVQKNSFIENTALFISPLNILKIRNK